MTDLDTLRRALQAQRHHGWDGPRTPDLGEIMTRGKRLRLRRRLAAAGGAMCAAGVVFGAVSGISHLTRPAPVPGQHPAGPARTVHSPSPRHTYASTPVSVPTPSSSPAVRFSATPSQGAGISTPIPTLGKASGSVPVATTGNGAASTLVPTPASSTMVPTPARASRLAAALLPFTRSGTSGVAVLVADCPLCGQFGGEEATLRRLES